MGSRRQRTVRARRVRTGLGVVAVLAGVVGTWETARRRDVSRLEADPDQDVLTCPLPGETLVVDSHDGTRLAAQIAGPRDAPATIVFVHGWGMGARFWIHQLRALADGYRVIAYDQRGHGASDPGAHDDYSVQTLAGDLTAVLDRLAERDRPLLAVGHSLGGMSILATAADGARPSNSRMDAALLIDTAASHLTASVFAGLGVAERLAAVAGARALRARYPVPARTTPLSSRAVRYTALSGSASPSSVALTEQLFFECPVDVRAAIGATLGVLDLSEALPRFTVPATVVVGTRDLLTPPGHARRLARALPRARLVELPGAGHQSPLERPEEVTDLVRGHVEAIRDDED